MARQRQDRFPPDPLNYGPGEPWRRVRRDGRRAVSGQGLRGAVPGIAALPPPLPRATGPRDIHARGPAVSLDATPEADRGTHLRAG